MTTLAATHSLREYSPGPLRAGWLIARRELRDAVLSRWFILYTLAFAALGLSVSYVSAGGVLAGYGRTAAGLVNIVLLIVPLMALTAGAGLVAGDRERGTLAYLLAQPLGRWEALLGKYLGAAGALVACICLGLGLCATVVALSGRGAQPGVILWLGGLSIALALGMLSVGTLLSVVVRRQSAAIGAGVFIWLLLVFVSDLGLMAGTLSMKFRVETLYLLSLINPLQVFKMWSLHAGEATLDVLGPVGLYAAEEHGARLHLYFGLDLAAWIVLPLALAGVVFSRRNPV